MSATMDETAPAAAAAPSVEAKRRTSKRVASAHAQLGRRGIKAESKRRYKPNGVRLARLPVRIL